MSARRRRYRNNSSSSGSIGWLYLLLFVAIIWIIVKLFWWIVGAIALVGLFFLAWAIVRENRKRRDAYARYCAEIAARADQQHNWVMQGDDCGAIAAYGAPDQLLTDNAKVFTGRFHQPPVEVLFDAICRENGREHLLTQPRSPTTAGKIERFHRTMRAEFLSDQRPFINLKVALRPI